MQQCPICGKHSPNSGSGGKSNKSKRARQLKKPTEFNEPAEWLEHLRAEVGDGGFFAAIRHETGSHPFPDYYKPPYDGCSLNDVPDKWYVDWIKTDDGEYSMTKGKYAGWSDMWYYTLAVNGQNDPNKEYDPNKYAKEHNLPLDFPPRKCPACGTPGSLSRR